MTLHMKHVVVDRCAAGWLSKDDPPQRTAQSFCSLLKACAACPEQLLTCRPAHRSVT